MCISLIKAPDPWSLAVLEVELEFELELVFLLRLQASTAKTKRPAASQAGWCFILRSSEWLALNKKSHATAARVAASERKISRPSLEPNRSSQARSGCGIRPSTSRELLQMPAILSREPFGFAASMAFPSGSQ